MFCLPRIWAADTCVPLSMHIIQIPLVSWLHVVDYVPPCLFMYAIAVELSDMILKCLTRTLRDKNDFMASFIARSSKQFMCNVFSESEHLPVIVWSSSCAPHPRLLASVCII